MKRRTLILAPLAVTSALAIGWVALPVRQRLLPADQPAAPAGEFAFSGWLRIGSDGRVLLVCPKTEMGQGVHMGLAMLLAEELEVAAERVQIATAPIDPIYGNLTTVVDALPFQPGDDSAWRTLMAHLTAKLMREGAPMLTGGSSSLKDLWLPVRQAGAAARQMLQQAAATRWGVPLAEVGSDAQAAGGAGVCRHLPTGRVLAYGELAAEAASLPVPMSPSLKAPAQWRLIGQPLPRADASGSARGEARFGIDVRLPGQRYAAVVLAPGVAGRVASVDDAAAKSMPGVLRVVTFAPPASGGSGGVAVIATGTWAAMQAARALKVQWQAVAEAEQLDADSTTLAQRFDAALAEGSSDPAHPYLERGDVDAALAAAATRLEARYDAPFLAHQALEPVNCTVRVDEGSATVWAPTQSPDIARGAVARALGLAADRVTVNVTRVGGGFGRRLDVDMVEQAALIARALPGVPVQTLWSREQDTRHDFYRPAAAARLRAGLDAQGRLVAWEHHIASPLLTPAVMQRYAAGLRFVPVLAQGQALTGRLLAPLGALPGVAVDKLSAEGAFDTAYAWPAARVRHTPVATAVPVGFWRSVGHSHLAFFTEGFVDECAVAARADAAAFRRTLLAGQPRHLAVLDAVTRAARWGQPVQPAPDGAPVAQGLAVHGCFGSVVAMVVEVSVAPGAERRIRVHRVLAAIDCGVVVNPNLVRQQVEGAVVFALSATLHGGITLERGRVVQAHFIDQPLLRLPEAPKVEVQVLASPQPHPEGVGEPGVPPLAPAVAAALFKLTGTRLRRLPLVLPALA